ncbi:hypothetical protein QQP08_010328 [Theobroma cacao]|nr:hypothetical protein QQP08_010328 [Theobroma cacao]
MPWSFLTVVNGNKFRLQCQRLKFHLDRGRMMREGERGNRGKESEDEESEEAKLREESRKPLWKRVLSLMRNEQLSSWSGVGRDIVSGSRGASPPHGFIIHPDDW